MSEKEREEFCNRLMKQIKITIKNVKTFSDFDLCGVRTAAKKLVQDIETEEDIRDEKEEYKVVCVSDKYTCVYCRQFHGYRMKGMKETKIQMDNMKEHCKSELKCRCKSKNIEDKGDKMKHKYEKHNNCIKLHCNICDGGLLLCTICNAAERELPTDCPGRAMTKDELEAVGDGKIDYKDDRWYNKP